MNNGDEKVAEARGTDDFYLASLHNKEGHVPLAAFDQHFPARDWTNHSVRGDPRDLRGTQRRKHERRIRRTRNKCRTFCPCQHVRLPGSRSSTCTSTCARGFGERVVVHRSARELM